MRLSRVLGLLDVSRGRGSRCPLAGLAVLMLVTPFSGALVGCAPRPRTQVTVEVDADDGIARDAVRLRVRIEGGATDLALRAEQTLGSADMPVTFPVRAAIVPLGGDVTRRFRVEAVALDREGRELGVVRALSSFVPERTLSILLVLEECCRAVRCGVGETCRSCGCVPEGVPPTGVDAGPIGLVDSALPDALLLDGGPPPIPDAGPADAGGGPPCITAYGCVDLAGPSRSLDTELGPRRWTRPLAGSCPAAAATGSFGYDVLRVHNSLPVAAGIQLTTTGSLVDAFLAVYEETAPDFAAQPPLPSDPSACLASLDETPGSEPQVTASFTFEPGETAVVVVTTSVPEQSGTATVGFTVLR